MDCDQIIGHLRSLVKGCNRAMVTLAFQELRSLVATLSYVVWTIVSESVTSLLTSSMKWTFYNLLRGKRHVPGMDLHGLKLNHIPQKVSRDPSRSFHGPSQIGAWCQLWQILSCYPSHIIHGPSRIALLWDWHVLESVTGVQLRAIVMRT